MDVLFHMIILAGVFYCVLRNDLKVHHKKAMTRAILLAVVSGLVHFFLKGLRLEGFVEGKKNKESSDCSDHTKPKDCSDNDCTWNWTDDSDHSQGGTCS